MVTIEKFNKADQSHIRDFVLHIQNVEFNLGFDENEQPDLVDTEKFYEGGCFWTAKQDGNIVGTIGIQVLDGQNAVLRKMFVKKELRGKELNVAQQLFDTLHNFAKAKQISTLWLDTPAVATSSHRFYERNGFVQTNKEGLPEGYIFPDKNSKIYQLAIH